ncbi:uncharacterized protein V6R79_019004 [Siganus canaliculatus]
MLQIWVGTRLDFKKICSDTKMCSVFHLRNGPLFYIASISISVLFRVNSAVESALVMSPQPIIAVAGDDVTLPCRLDPPADARSMTVTWIKPSLDSKYIHVLKDGRQHWIHQNESYRHRTLMFTDELVNGNLSLKLFRVTPVHAGSYECSVSSFPEEASVQLVVGAVSTPTIEASSINSQGVALLCRSEGWYPEPQLSWLDGEGNLIPADHEEMVRRADGRYDGVSRVVVKHHDIYTCRVQNPLNQTRHGLVRVPADFFMESCTPLIWPLVIFSSATVFLLGYISWEKIRSYRTRQSIDLQEVLSDLDLTKAMLGPNPSEKHPEDHSPEKPGPDSSGGECTSDQQQLTFKPNGNMIYKSCQKRSATL